MSDDSLTSMLPCHTPWAHWTPLMPACGQSLWPSSA